MNSCHEECLVVLVEDDESIRATFAEVLQSEGYHVLAFANGREALAGLQRRPCLILLDWMMPGMSGEQFLKARHGAAAPDCPVVVVTAMPEMARKLPGISALLRKPVDLEGLLSVVKRHCRHSEAQGLPRPSVAC